MKKSKETSAVAAATAPVAPPKPKVDKAKVSEMATAVMNLLNAQCNEPAVKKRVLSMCYKVYKAVKKSC